MSCNNCNCLDCARQYAIDSAMNRSNDDEPVSSRPSPIHWQSTKDVEPANEGQIKTWTEYANRIFIHYKVDKAIPMPTLINMVAQQCNVRPENYHRVTEQMRQVFMTSPDFSYRKGKNGGIFRKPSVVEGHAQTGARVEQSVVASAKSIGDLIREKLAANPVNPLGLEPAKLVNNCSCKGCGTGLNTSERSCWKCGAQQ